MASERRKWNGDKELEGILIFAGTTEGRELSEALAGAGISHTVCVATEYGEISLKPNPYASVRRGRMGREEIAGFLQEGQFAAVVDATHPFAKEVTANIKAGLEGLVPVSAAGKGSLPRAQAPPDRKSVV